jgi:hypothetical protein
MEEYWSGEVSFSGSELKGCRDARSPYRDIEARILTYHKDHHILHFSTKR